MDVNEEIIPSGDCNQVAQDFADQLPPGYRFCPTDSELIVYYLNAKIESRQLPECRLHEFNIYNHKPEELAERYRSSENKWYFLTPRDRKYAKGKRPSRTVGNFGHWKTTQKQKPVHDQATGQMVGHKGTLTFFDKNKKKTMWLMQEYTTNRPDLPFGSGENFHKLNEWVLCKIYKNETNQSGDGDEEYGNATIQEELMEEENRSHEVPFPKRLRASEDLESNFANYYEVVEANQQSTAPMKTSPSPIPMQPRATFQGSISIQPAPYCYHNQFISDASNGPEFSNGASISVSMEAPEVHHDVPQQQYFDQMWYQDPQSQLYMQNGSDQHTVMPHDASNDIPQPDGYGAPSSPLDTDTWSLEDLGMRHEDIPQPDGDNASTLPLRIDDLETVPIESLLEIFF